MLAEAARAGSLLSDWHCRTKDRRRGRDKMRTLKKVLIFLLAGIIWGYISAARKIREWKNNI